MSRLLRLRLGQPIADYLEDIIRGDVAREALGSSHINTRLAVSKFERRDRTNSPAS